MTDRTRRPLEVSQRTQLQGWRASSFMAHATRWQSFAIVLSWPATEHRVDAPRPPRMPSRRRSWRCRLRRHEATATAAAAAGSFARPDVLDARSAVFKRSELVGFSIFHAFHRRRPRRLQRHQGSDASAADDGRTGSRRMSHASTPPMASMTACSTMAGHNDRVISTIAVKTRPSRPVRTMPASPW